MRPAVALVLLLPNLWWQAAHGWPIFEVLHGDAAHRPVASNGLALEYHGPRDERAAFALEQLLYTNPAGGADLAAGRDRAVSHAALRDVRFVSVAYLVLFVVAAALAAKGYYIVGSIRVALARRCGRARVLPAWFCETRCSRCSARSGSSRCRFRFRCCRSSGFIAYTQMLGLTGRDGTRRRSDPAGLRRRVRLGAARARRCSRVRFAAAGRPRARRDLCRHVRRRRRARFLRPAIRFAASDLKPEQLLSVGHARYDGSTMMAIGATRIDLLERYYRSVMLVRTSTEPHKWIVEGPAPIYLCRDPVAPLKEIWPNLRWYGA